MSQQYTSGQQFNFTRGDRVVCNGFAGTVIRMYSAGMVEVRLGSGGVCVPSCFPDCYPATEAEYLTLRP